MIQASQPQSCRLFRSAFSIGVVFLVFEAGTMRLLGGVTEIERLDASVSEYFLTENESNRTRLADALDRTIGDRIDLLADLIARAQLWSVLPQTGVIKLPDVPNPRISINYKLPSNYDPSHAYPLLFCMMGNESTPESQYKDTRELLGSAFADWVFAAPDRSINPTFRADSNDPPDLLRQVLREIRKKIHIDSNRVFLFGQDDGGDTAWLSAMMNADEFAGLMTVQAYPRISYPEQSLPLFCGNFQSVSVLSIWADATPSSSDSRTQRVAESMKWFETYSKNTYATFESVRIADQGSSPHLNSETSARFLQSQRPTCRTTVSLWFRYPEHGRASWLRVVKFGGEVWTDDQLSILPAPGTDRNEYISSVLKDHLGFLSGRIEGQTIDITSHRCAEIELLLPANSVDFAKPIAVRCKGRIRHRGMIQPDVKTLLETAYADWDFQRLAVARLTIRIRSDDKSP